jgi:peroxiredoxin (alkyl hydroperoxide reductase subunit C)
MAVTVGQPAPDFTLPDSDRNQVTLSSLRGQKNVVLVFYVLAFTGGCRSELVAFRDLNAEFEKSETKVYGISVDTPMSLAVFAHSIDLNFPLLSDFPQHQATQAYGTYDPASGTSRRVTFVVDMDGVVQAEIVSDHDMRRHASEAIDVVRKLQGVTSELSPLVGPGKHSQGAPGPEP